MEAATQRVELRDVKRIARRRVAVELDFRRSIVKAHTAGASLRQIAFAASLSHVRILQILREEEAKETIDSFHDYPSAVAPPGCR